MWTADRMRPIVTMTGSHPSLHPSHTALVILADGQFLQDMASKESDTFVARYR
jgi:hypothetical protein